MSSPIDLRSFVNGARIDAASDRAIEQFDPATGRSRGTFAAAGTEAVNSAVCAARGALDGPWGSLPPVARAGMLKALADLIEKNAGRLAEADCADMGKPVSAGGFEAGVVARLGTCTVDWCRVSAGGYRGWTLKGNLWGVDPAEIRE